MRRTNPDFGYKDETRSLVNVNFEPWQLIHRDEREGIHRWLNRLVSYSLDIDTEMSYVERMFFPEQCDINEPWVVYRTDPDLPLSDISISGEPASTVITLADSMDEFLAGPFTNLQDHLYMSGETAYLSLMSENIANIHMIPVMSGIAEYTADMLESTFATKSDNDTSQYYEVEAILDTTNHAIILTDDIDKESLSVKIGGVNISYTLYQPEDFSGRFMDQFDADNNGYIGEYEHRLLTGILGMRMSDMGIDDWNEISWADVDGDGHISEQDYTVIMSSIPSVRSDVKSVVFASPMAKGIVTARYKLRSSIPSIIYSDDGVPSVLYQTDTLSELYDAIAYDSRYDIYYVISNNNTQLHAITYNKVLDTVTGTSLILCQRPSSAHLLLDMDIYDGYLFVLVSDGTTHQIVYGDIWSEYLEELKYTADIRFNRQFTPVMLSIGNDGGFIVGDGKSLIHLKSEMDRCIEVNGSAFFNQRRNDLTNLSGEVVTAVPHYVFNNLDSFAYSIGIRRPWGKDNIWMRKAIRDFYRHRQGLDAIGASYGITRELGFANKTVVPSGHVYYLDASIDTSGDIAINDTPVNVIDDTNDCVTLSGDGEYHSITSQRYLNVYHTSDYTLTLSGSFEDGDGYYVPCVYTLDILSGIRVPDIRVRSFDERDYLINHGYMDISGTPSSELISFVHKYEQSEPGIYRNAVTNITETDQVRFSPNPVIITSYDPDINELLTTEEVITL